MMKKNENHKSEFREDIVSGDWVLFAPGRFHETKTSLKKGIKREVPPEREDIFKNPFKSVSEHVILRYAKGVKIKNGNDNEKKNWEIVVLENKYPAVFHDAQKITVGKSPAPVMPGLGHHDLLITREYRENFPRLSPDTAFHVFDIFRERYLMLFGDSHIKYVSIFHNWGKRAGATVFHPHYQILGIPLVPPVVAASLLNAKKYFIQHKKCVHCALIEAELKNKKRIIAETEHAIALAPFASRVNFEVKIFPKVHRPFFENMPDTELADIAGLLQKVLGKIEKNLGDPDYNFYIHTAPVERKRQYPFYHWHIEIIPRKNIHAGFEYATGMYITTVDPDFTASVLRD